MPSRSHAHALFSWFDDIILDGRLLKGPDKHYYSTDLPAYEFRVTDPATGKRLDYLAGGNGTQAGDQLVHALVRASADNTQWLVALRAADGVNRNVNVLLTDAGSGLNLGTYSLLARDAGSLYWFRTVNGSIRYDLVDADPMNPSASVATIVPEPGALLLPLSGLPALRRGRQKQSQ